MLADVRAAGNKKTYTEKDFFFRKRYYSNLQTLFIPANYVFLFWEPLKLFDSTHLIKKFWTTQAVTVHVYTLCFWGRNPPEPSDKPTAPPSQHSVSASSPTKLKPASKQEMSKWLRGTMKLLLLQEEWVYNTVANEILRFFTLTFTFSPLPHGVFCASVRGKGPPQEHVLLLPWNTCWVSTAHL